MDGSHGRVHVKPDQVTDLLDELRVGRNLETVFTPWFQPERTPDLCHGLMADPMFGGETPSGPVRRVWRGGFQCLNQNRFDHVVGDGARSTRAGRVDQPIETINSETVPPLRHRRRVHAQPGRNLPVGRSRGEDADDLLFSASHARFVTF